MSRDPFDEMQSRNPVPRDQVPGAPMSVAERILAGRPRVAWPGWAVGAATAAAVAVIGFGALWWLGDGSGAPVADGGDTTTTEIDVTTTVPVVSTTVVDVDARTVVYFFLDATGPGWAGGPFLVPVERTVEDSDLLAATVRALLEGPDSGMTEAVPAMSTAIPAGTTLNDIVVSEGVAVVDLSGEFASGGGSFSMTGRIAQVVYTLTRLEWTPCAACPPAHIDGVQFLIDGIPTTVFGGEGVTVDDPATRSGFDGVLPAILIESPVYFDFAGSNPLVATGNANVFEATVSWALTDGDGLIIAEGFTTATCGTGCRGDWELTIPYEVDAPQLGSLIVWESSAMDGSQTNVREHPVWLTPADPGTSTTTLPDTSCSGSLIDDALVDQPDLPLAVAQKRAEIFDAARTCDWGRLAQLMAEGGFRASFGIDDDPIGMWLHEEAEGRQPMRYLAGLLQLPYAFDGTYYTWPSVFTQNWAAVTEKERDVLRPLYDEEDFAGWDAFGGYIGYRIGINADGEWVFFIAGD